MNVQLSLHPKIAIRREHLGVASLAGLLFIGATWAWMHPSPPTPSWREALVFDASKTAAQARRCADGRRLAGQIFEQAPGDVQLVVFQTGDKTTNLQPIRLGMVATAHSLRLLEGNVDDSGRRQSLAEADRLCMAVRVTADSPLVDDLAAVVDAMPANECSKPQAHCRVTFRTDGGEEFNQDFIAALNRFPEEPHDPALGVKINNDHVDILICGVSERTVTMKPARRNPRERPLPSYEAVKAAFARVVSNPERLRVEPFCAALQMAMPTNTQTEQR